MARHDAEPTLTALLARYDEAAEDLHATRIAAADAELEYARRDGMVRADAGAVSHVDAQTDRAQANLRAASHELAVARLHVRDALLAVRRTRVSLLVRRPTP